MKKVLAVFDGAHYPSALLDFALQLNSESPILLTGVFLPSVDYAEAISYYYYGNPVAPLYLPEHESDDQAIRRNIHQFREYCELHNIRCSVHKGIQDKVVKGLKYESRHADLMLLCGADFYENLGTDIQEQYLHETLHQVECPVVILPASYQPVRNVIMAYDGSAASMHAIRQFVYLLPEFSELKSLIVYASGTDDDVPFLDLIREYAPQHFNNIAFYKLEADPKKYFTTWLENQPESILVSGSYGRSFLSEIVKRNFVADIIREHKFPVFIAHR